MCDTHSEQINELAKALAAAQAGLTAAQAAQAGVDGSHRGKGETLA